MMGNTLMGMLPPGNVATPQPRLELFLPISGGFTICTEMCANGVRTRGRRITTGPRLMEVPGKKTVIVAASCVEARGSTAHGFADQRVVSGTALNPMAGTTVFGWLR